MYMYVFNLSEVHMYVEMFYIVTYSGQNHMTPNAVT